MLITRPEHDDTTFYCSKWAGNVIKEADKKGFDVFDLSREKANKDRVESILANKQPRLVFFNGHGDDETIFGHNDEILIKNGANEDLLESKIIYAVSCSSAKELGKAAVEKGAGAYIGYEDDFVFIGDTNSSARPLSDQFAKPFFESSNQIPLSLVNGSKAIDASAKSQKIFQYWITYFRTLGESLPEAPEILKQLLWDKKNQVIRGNQDASIS